jgi:hypothetical protein
MNLERAREILDNAGEEVGRDYCDDFVKGVAILGKYVKGRFNYSFEHDQMWFGEFEETVVQMTEEEVVSLVKYGWFEDKETDSWGKFS